MDHEDQGLQDEQEVQVYFWQRKTSMVVIQLVLE